VITAFLIIGIVCTLIALIAALFDGAFESMDIDLPGAGEFSILALTGGLAGFGWSGYAIDSLTNLPNWAVILLAIVVGLAIAALGMLFTKMLRAQSTPDGAGSVSGLVGVTGVMDVAAGPGHQGVVRVTYAGSARTLTAHTDQPVGAGDLVTITDVISPDVVRVTRESRT
jgi:membrane protein implicated in regulation of membrane protease activity